MVAALALGSVIASAAQAEGHFKAGKYPASLTGNSTSTHTFSFAGGVRKISCGESTFTSSKELAAESESVGIWWNYRFCSVNGGLPLWIQSNGCSLTWSVTSVLSPTTATGAQSFNCPAGQEFKWVIFANAEEEAKGNPMCTYGIPAQGPLATIGYQNIGSGSTASVDMEMNISSIQVNVVAGTKLLCGAKAGSTITAQYTGNVNLIAKNAGVQTGLTIG
jgi:hypothetical protein